MPQRRLTLVLLAAVFLCLGAALSFPSYQYPPTAELRKKAHYLERIICTPPGESTELQAVDHQNPEWALFSLSYAVFAFTNMAALDSSFRAEASHYTELAIQRALTEEISAFYKFRNAPPTGVDTAGSVIYLGHLNLMLGCHRLLNPNSRFAGLHDTLTRVLHGRYRRTPSHNLESYQGLTWVADNTVALASLQLHSQLTGSPYGQFCPQWVAYARRHLLDPPSGLLISSIGTATQAFDGPRGSSAGWSNFFIYRFDPAFAAEQYQCYQAHCSTNLGVVRLYRERAGTYTTDPGDIDSGPLLLGYGIPATAFAFADAVALRDWRNAQRLRRVIALGSKRLETPQEIQYGVRFVDLSVSPLAEALLLHAETMTPWVKQ